MRKVFVRSPYNYDTEQASLVSGLDASEEVSPSKTIQSAKEECDINVIVKRFGLTGQFTPPARLPAYRDYDGVMDFHTAMNAIRQAEESFMELPAEIRFRFGNDPNQYLSFVSDHKNIDEMVALGIASKPRSDKIELGNVPNSEKDDGQDASGVGVGKGAKASGKSGKGSASDAGVG